MSDFGSLDRADADRVSQALLSRVSEKAPERRLHAIRRLTELLGDPQRMYGVIHIAGTNGKTSKACFERSGCEPV